MTRAWSSRPRLRRPAARPLRLVAALALAACGRGSEGGVEAPLFDADHVPDVLVESHLLEPPPSLGGNSFVRGWSPWRERLARAHEVTHLAAGGEAQAALSVVNLEPRPRTLKLLAPRQVAGEESPELELRWAGGEAARQAASASEVHLAATDRLGRVALELRLPPEVIWALDGAELHEALPAGRVEVDGEDLTQSGYSLVDFARHLAAPTTLAARFTPPQEPDPAQSFSLIVERDGEPPWEAWTWRPTWWNRLRGSRELAVPLGEAGLTRLRFLARGTGPPATWKGLRLRAPAAASAIGPPAETTPSAPRLVLVYVMDALRADQVGHLGGPAGISPTLDRLASEGVVLEGHQALASNTLPSVKNLFTGRVYLDDGMADLPPAAQGPPTLAEVFGGAGYTSGLFTGNGYVYYQAQRGFDHADESVLYERHGAGARYNDNAERVHAAALRWLDGLPRDERVFLYLHTVHPHNPYQPPPAIERRWTADIDSRVAGDTETLLAVKRGRLPVGPSDRARIRALYQSGIAYNDAELGGFLAALESRYPPPELLAVLTADHGEELFDHGGMLHGYTLYGEQLRVPLTLWWPGRLAPRRLELASDHLDLHATLRRLVEPQASPPPEARSLWPLLAGEPARSGDRLRFAVAAGVPGGIFSVQDGRWKLIWAPRQGAGWGQGEGLGRSHDALALFDLAADPGETANLAGTESVEVAWLRSRLLGWMARQRALPAAAAQPPPGADQRENLEALGYVD